MRLAWLAAAVLCAMLLGSEQPELRLIEVHPGHPHAATFHTRMLPGFSGEAHIYAPLGTDLTAHINHIARFNEREKLASLQSALDQADENGLVAYDCMTQRFDVAYQIQRQMVSDRDILGDPVKGTPDAPAVRMENLHALLKGTSQRPAWYFDIQQQGEGIADVGTHLVDLVEWTLFADQAIDYRRDIRMERAERWPTILTGEQFERVTGEKPWPAYLQGAVKDSYFASYQGTNARVELRQGAEEHYNPELYLFPARADGREQLLATLRKKLPRLDLKVEGERIHVRNPGSLPPWEKPNMIAKYYITTTAVQLAREKRP